MKKKTLTTACMAVALSATPLRAQQAVELPAPAKDAPMTLMQALQERHSERAFAARPVSDATLSTLLWAACGVNRPAEGKLTAPSAINAQDVVAYVLRADGAFRYDAQHDALQKVTARDLRSLAAGRQDFAATAPLTLLLVSDHSRFPAELPADAKARMGAIDAAYVSANIGLACTALGLATVPRMTMDTQALRSALNLGEQYDLILNNPVGFPADK